MESTTNSSGLAEEPIAGFYENPKSVINLFEVEGKTPFNIHSFRIKLIGMYQKAVKQIKDHEEDKRPCPLVYVRGPTCSSNQLIDVSNPKQREHFEQLLDIYRGNSTLCKRFFKDKGNKNKDFCKSYFQQEALREGLIIYMNILFKNREPYEHIARFKVLCCRRISHNDECKCKWDLLYNLMLDDLLNKFKS